MPEEDTGKCLVCEEGELQHPCKLCRAFLYCSKGEFEALPLPHSTGVTFAFVRSGGLEMLDYINFVENHGYPCSGRVPRGLAEGERPPMRNTADGGVLRSWSRSQRFPRWR